MDKSSIIKKILKQEEVKLKEKRGEVELIKNQMMIASGSRSTKPESDKKVYQRIKEEIEASIGRCEEAVEMLKSFSTKATEVVSAGALVELSMDEKIMFCLVVPRADMCPITIKVKGQTLNFMSVKSPVGQAILGLRASDTTTVNRKEVKIVSVK